MAAIATTTQVERYEYKFVRVGAYRGSALFGVRDSEILVTAIWLGSGQVCMSDGA